MLSFGAPALLLAGLLATLLPLALHLLRPRPGSPRALPTARFLEPEARSRIRLSRPDHVLLLALRMLLLALAGAALAAPGWTPRSRGGGEIVMLDRAAGVDPAAWRAAVAEARRRQPEALIVFDTTARLFTARDLSPAFFDRLVADTASVPSELAAAMRRLPDAVRSLQTADSLHVTLVSPLRAASWTEGTGALRGVAWPGTISLVPVEGPAPAVAAREPPHGAAAVWSEPGNGVFVRAALGAAGYSLEDSADVVVVLRQISAEEEEELDARARAGATVVQDEMGAGTLDGTAHLVLPGLGPIAGAERRAPVAGARMVAAWDDGRTAAAATPLGRGCRVRFGAGLEAGDLPLASEYPHLLAALATACRGDREEPHGTLDPGARAVLAGSGPAWTPARPLGLSIPIPLGRWVMGLALLIALAEALVARRAGRAA